MRTIILIFTLLLPTLAGAEEFDGDYPVVFDPAEPPADSYESIRRIYVGEVQDDETGQTFKACIIDLERHDWPAEGGIPLDETGNPFILLDDGMTFLSAEDVYGSIDPETCDFYDYEASNLLASSVLCYAS